MSTSAGYYYESAHRDCHPETCSCREDWRIRNASGVTVEWASSLPEAKAKVKWLNTKVGCTRKGYGYE